MPASPPATETTYVETPAGLFTAGGVWFHTTAEALATYAGPVLERVPLGELLARAEVWLGSARTLTLWVLPVALLFVPPLPAALGSLTLYVGWRLLSPAWVSALLLPVVRVLRLVLVQAALYVAVLSVLASAGAYAAVGTGLAGFVLLRWGLLERLTRPALQLGWRSLFPLPPADQVLRSLIVRLALRHNVPLPEIERLEHDVRARLGGKRS